MSAGTVVVSNRHRRRGDPLACLVRALIATALVAVWFPAEAWSLSLRGCYDDLIVRPADGADGVPINTEIQLFKNELRRPLVRTQVELFDEAGAPIPLRVVDDGHAVLRMKPEQDLAPDTRYRIVVNAPPPPADRKQIYGWATAPPTWLEGKPNLELWFETSTERDTTPPALSRAEVRFFGADSWQRMKGKTWREVTFDIEASDSQDLAPMKLAFVGESADGLALVEIAPSPKHYLGNWPCAGWRLDDSKRFAAGGAIDLAGNIARGDPVEREDVYWDKPRIYVASSMVLGTGLLSGMLVVAVRGIRKRARRAE